MSEKSSSDFCPLEDSKGIMWIPYRKGLLSIGLKADLEGKSHAEIIEAIAASIPLAEYYELSVEYKGTRH